MGLEHLDLRSHGFFALADRDLVYAFGLYGYTSRTWLLTVTLIKDYCHVPHSSEDIRTLDLFFLHSVQAFAVTTPAPRRRRELLSSIRSRDVASECLVANF